MSWADDDNGVAGRFGDRVMSGKDRGVGERHLDLRRASRWIVGLFWLIQFAELTVLSFVEDGTVATRALLPRLVVLVAGIALMFGFVEIVARFERRPFRVRLLLTITWALLLCLVLVAINFAIFRFMSIEADKPVNPAEYFYIAFAWSWFFLSVAGALLALSYNVEGREREHRLAALEAVAKEAQLAALRYQLNPHFLFNTLNSIASLIANREGDAAESMVENLADFLRATLELDPVEDISLGREVELQRMYLAIEQVRFPERLVTTFDVPEELAHARVPALITQPLVENAIRHAVARSAKPVTIRLAAMSANGMLTLIVEDDGRPSRPAAKGTGVGLRNVGARLAGRFGSNQSLTTERPSMGGLRVTLSFPLLLSNES